MNLEFLTDFFIWICQARPGRQDFTTIIGRFLDRTARETPSDTAYVVSTVYMVFLIFHIRNIRMVCTPYDTTHISCMVIVFFRVLSIRLKTARYIAFIDRRSDAAPSIRHASDATHIGHIDMGFPVQIGLIAVIAIIDIGIVRMILILFGN